VEHLRQQLQIDDVAIPLPRVSKSARTGIPTLSLVCYLTGSVLFLYLSLFVLNVGPIYRNGDQLIFLENAVKMLDGQTMYSDFFQSITPGTEFVYFCLFKLAGVHLWIPSLVLILVGSGFMCLSVAITRRLLSGADVFLPGLLFLTCGYFWFLDGTHHWFSSLCVMAAAVLLMDNRSTARLLAAGGLCGLALCFTQLRGPVALLGLLVFLLWEYRDKRQTSAVLLARLACVAGAFLLVVVGFNAYFAWKAGLAQFWWCTVTFVLKYYPAWPLNTWRMLLLSFPRLHQGSHELPHVARYLFNIGIAPLVYVVFFCCYSWIRRSCPRELSDRLMLLGLIGASLFMGIAPAVGELRAVCIYLPALILMVWLFRSWGKAGRRILYALWVTALLLAVVEPASRQTHWRAQLDLPTGRMAILDPLTYDMHRWMLERTKPSEQFFEEEVPRLYFTLDLRNPTPVPFLTNTEYTRPEQVRDVIQALAAHQVRLVMVSPFLNLPPYGQDWGDHLAPLRAYLDTHYQRVKTFPNGEQFWERQEAER
jgi:hypothetical protein